MIRSRVKHRKSCVNYTHNVECSEKRAFALLHLPLTQPFRPPYTHPYKCISIADGGEWASSENEIANNKFVLLPSEKTRKKEWDEEKFSFLEFSFSSRHPSKSPHCQRQDRGSRREKMIIFELRLVGVKRGRNRKGKTKLSLEKLLMERNKFVEFLFFLLWVNICVCGRAGGGRKNVLNGKSFLRLAISLHNGFHAILCMCSGAICRSSRVGNAASRLEKE